jgi:hypothetical protein
MKAAQDPIRRDATISGKRRCFLIKKPIPTVPSREMMSGTPPQHDTDRRVIKPLKTMILPNDFPFWAPSFPAVFSRI